MITFPNAKINIGLFVTEKRADGFHNLETCFYPIPLSDTLEILPSSELKFSSSGIPVAGPQSHNLCIRAYELLKAKYKLPYVHIHLHKNIPMGAGLGGGSSDAAFTIKLLNDLFILNMKATEMENHARLLGSDCAFFIQNKPVLATGRGDIFTETTFSLHQKYLLLVYPAIHISTAEAYAGVTPAKPEKSLFHLLSAEPEWKSIKNDFEKSVFPAHPELNQLKNKLEETDAFYVSMSGSGSAFYALYNKKPAFPDLPENYRCEIMQLN